jgi:hypothetical protein
VEFLARSFVAGTDWLEAEGFVRKRQFVRLFIAAGLGFVILVLVMAGLGFLFLPRQNSRGIVVANRYRFGGGASKPT